MASARRGRAALGLLFVGVLLQACASGPPPTATDLGEQALERGDWRSARNQFTIALRSDPRDGRAWLGQARAELAGRDPEAALGSLGNLARVDRARWLDPDQGKPVYADALEAATRRRGPRSIPTDAGWIVCSATPCSPRATACGCSVNARRHTRSSRRRAGWCRIGSRHGWARPRS